MQNLLSQIQIRVNDKIYLKDPESSDLGKKLVKEAVRMIHDIGFEAFTFKKLATKMGTTESTIYRYFENKHKLLLYLISWYWGWLEYEMVFRTANISDPLEKLAKTIGTICDPIKDEIKHEFIDLKLLYEIVVAESPKAYLTKEVDSENKNGVFANYKRICERFSNIIEEISPDFKYAKTVASSVIESANMQRFFALHFPNLTNIDRKASALGMLFTDMVVKTIQSN